MGWFQRTGDANLDYIKLLGDCWQSSSVDELVIEPGYEYWYHGSTSINIHRIQTEGVQLSSPNPQSFGTIPSFYLTNFRSFAISRAMQKMTQSSTRSEGGAIIRFKIPQGHWETLQPHLILTQTSGAPNGLELLTTEQACNGDYQWTVSESHRERDIVPVDRVIPNRIRYIKGKNHETPLGGVYPIPPEDIIAVRCMEIAAWLNTRTDGIEYVNNDIIT